MIRPRPKYEDHKMYPILVPIGGYNRIVEMLGRDINAYNQAIEVRYENRTTV
jgi:hypothetical protein